MWPCTAQWGTAKWGTASRDLDTPAWCAMAAAAAHGTGGAPLPHPICLHMHTPTPRPPARQTPRRSHTSHTAASRAWVPTLLPLPGTPSTLGVTVALTRHLPGAGHPSHRTPQPPHETRLPSSHVQVQQCRCQDDGVLGAHGGSAAPGRTSDRCTALPTTSLPGSRPHPLDVPNPTAQSEDPRPLTQIGSHGYLPWPRRGSVPEGQTRSGCPWGPSTPPKPGVEKGAGRCCGTELVSGGPGLA